MEKQQFYNAVLELQQEKTLATISVRDIASNLNISTGLLYYHFKNKDDLLNQMFVTFKNNINESLVINDESISEILLEYISFNSKNIEEYKFTLSSELSQFLSSESLAFSKNIHLQLIDKFKMNNSPTHVVTIVFGSIRSLLTAPPYFESPAVEPFAEELSKIIESYK